MEQQKNIPSLRFPEFSGDWKEKKIDDIAEKVNSGKTPLGGEAVYVEKGVLFIRSQNVLDSKLSLDNSTYITDEVNKTMKNSVVYPNDILLNITGASLGRSCVVPNNFSVGNVNQHVCIIRLNKENESAFLQPIFASEKGQNIFTSLQTGSGREGLNFQSIRGIKLHFPSLTEQTKIASFLTKVDEKLTALKKKKEMLEQYKKGVMQQIFSQELRFKDDDGNDFPDWEEKKLCEVLKIQGGFAFKSSSFGHSGITKVLRIGDIKSSIDLDKFKGVYSEETPDKKYLVKKNDFLMALSGATFGKVGKIVSEGIGHINQRVATFRTNQCLEYFFQLVQSEDFKNYITSIPTASAQPNISNDDIGNYISLIPTENEQYKIANFLSTIDNKITYCQSQIDKTEEWKKGLLQQMFC